MQFQLSIMTEALGYSSSLALALLSGRNSLRYADILEWSIVVECVAMRINVHAKAWVAQEHCLRRASSRA